MGGRDHAIECEDHPGTFYSGFNGPDDCPLCLSSAEVAPDHGSEEGGRYIRICRNPNEPFYWDTDKADDPCPSGECQGTDAEHETWVPASQLDSAITRAARLEGLHDRAVLRERSLRTELERVIGELERRARSIATKRTNAPSDELYHAASLLRSLINGEGVST